MWDVPQALGISPEQQRTLEAWIGARNTPQKVVFRSRIVLMAAEGKANRRIAEQLQTSRPTVILWRKRFAEGGGAAALNEDVPGAWPQATDFFREDEEDRGGDLTHQAESRHPLECAIDGPSARRQSGDRTADLGRPRGLQPHRSRRFKLSRDKQFSRC